MPRHGENIYKRKDGRWEGRYIIGYRESGKARYGAVYAHSYQEVKQKLNQAKNGQLVKKTAVTVEELFDLWLERERSFVKQSTYSNYYTLIRSHILPEIGCMRLDKVTSFTLDKLITQKLQDGRLDNSGGLSPKTVQNIVIIIKSAFKFAHREFHIPNAAENIGLPRVSAKEIEVFSNEEIALLTQYLTTDCDISKLGILLCLYTGIRLGEVCALKWSDFEFQENFLKVRRTIQRIQNPEPEPPKTKVIIDSPKSVKSIRDIPLPNNLSKDLRRYAQMAPGNGFFLTGSPYYYIEPRTYQSRYKMYLQKGRIPYRNFHALRHTFVTKCIELGVDIKSLSEILGHSSVTITLNRYVHSSMDLKQQQINKLEQLVSL